LISSKIISSFIRLRYEHFPVVQGFAPFLSRIRTASKSFYFKA